MKDRSYWMHDLRRSVPILVLLFTGLLGCDKGKDHGPSGGAAAKGTEASEEAGHGTSTELGTVTIASHEFSVVGYGEVVAGTDAAFEVQGVGISEAELAKLNLYLWVEAEDGAQLSAPAKGTREDEGFHFHVTPRAGKGDPHRIVLRIRGDGVDERSGLPLSGHGHEHDDGPHHGVLASLLSKSGTKGFLELKLHHDKGDLELWLSKDKQISVPLDLSLDATIEIEFIDVLSRKVALRVRNTSMNEDEDGNPNVRDGQTNYFMFPSQPSEDASWLQGKEFSSIVVVRFASGGDAFESEEFVLKPHVH